MRTSAKSLPFKITFVIALALTMLCLVAVGAFASVPDAGIGADVSALTQSVIVLEQATDTTAKHMALAGVVAAILKFLLDAFMFSVKDVDLKDKVKRWLPAVCALVGVLIAVFAKYAEKSSWVDSVIVAGGAPLAVLFNDVLNMMKKPAPSTTSKLDVPLSSVPPDPPIKAA